MKRTLIGVGKPSTMSLLELQRLYQAEETNSAHPAMFCEAHKRLEAWVDYTSHCQHCGGPNH